MVLIQISINFTSNILCMSYFVVDVESDGPFPEAITGYSMVCFGAIKVDDALDKTFYGGVAPISNVFNPEALAVSGNSREQHRNFKHPSVVMQEFDAWIKETSKGHPIFISDNPAYDFAFINYYFHKFLGKNPFGFSGRRIGDLYCGMVKDSRAKWKHLRVTQHTHNPVDDAKGNAEALLAIKKMGLKIDL